MHDYGLRGKLAEDYFHAVCLNQTVFPRVIENLRSGVANCNWMACLSATLYRYA